MMKLILEPLNRGYPTMKRTIVGLVFVIVLPLLHPVRLVIRRTFGADVRRTSESGPDRSGAVLIVQAVTQE